MEVDFHNGSENEHDRIDTVRIWHEADGGEFNFVAKIASITIKGGQRAIVIKPIDIASISDFARKFSQVEDGTLYRIIFCLPQEIMNGNVESAVFVETDAKITELSIKDAPSIKAYIQQQATNELNEHCTLWTDYIRIRIDRRQAPLFGEEIEMM